MSKMYEQGNLRGKHMTNILLKTCSNLLENRKYKSRADEISIYIYPIGKN